MFLKKETSDTVQPAAESQLTALDTGLDWIATSHSPPSGRTGELHRCQSSSFLYKTVYKMQTKLMAAGFSVSEHVFSEWLTFQKRRREEKKRADYDCRSKPQEGCGYVFAAHLETYLEKLWPRSMFKYQWKKLQLWEWSELTGERGGHRLQMYTEPKCLMFHSD